MLSDNFEQSLVLSNSYSDQEFLARSSLRRQRPWKGSARHSSFKYPSPIRAAVLRKRMLARTYQPKFFSNMAVGVPEGRCTQRFLAAVSFRVGTAFFATVDVTENLTKLSFKFHYEEEMEKEMETKTSRPLARLLNRVHADGSSYGIMGGDVFKRARIKRAHIVASLTCLSLVLTLSGGIMVSEHATVQSLGKPAKVSSDLSVKAHGLTNSDTVTVIVQLQAPMSSSLNSLLNSNGVHVRKTFQTMGAHAVEMPASIVDTVAAFDEVSFVSFDRPTQSMGHLSATTGADAVRNTSGINVSGVDGTGIGIAVLDSGIYTSHVNFLDKSNNVRVVYSQDFTGENRTDDPYGHGSHVAAIAAGSGRVSNAAYLGIAPNANLINLRVLNSQGTGTVSGTLTALDWVMANKATYNIRVVNMSLGTAAVDSYKNDPVCRAVRRLVNAGVVVVVAAGNNGKNAAGQKVYGMIHCPGNEPSAITVGASNTFGTDSRNDDGVTTYSSRGPTRSSWTDTLGVKHYDGLMKPDLVAPGNKIIEARAVNNLLVSQNPQLAANVSPVATRDQMYLNGTSMASPVVAGAAALLLQANPSLTPNMVKAILEYTAQPLAGFNT